MTGASRTWAALAGVNGFTAVAVGAFAAHGVSDPRIVSLLHTGSQYQGLHAVAALACLGLSRSAPRRASLAGWLFGAGALVFGGSLYVLAATGVTLWGAITPIGGLLLLAGWAVIAWTGLSRESGAQPGEP